MKKKLLLLSLICYSTAFGESGLFGSQLQYQDVVAMTAVGVVFYAYNVCDSVAKWGDTLKHYASLAIAGGAGLAVFYSNQFNNMIPERLRVNEFCGGLNTILPYWFAFIIAAATYSNFCDRYDYYFKLEKKDDPNKPIAVFGVKNIQ